MLDLSLGTCIYSFCHYNFVTYQGKINFLQDGIAAEKHAQ